MTVAYADFVADYPEFASATRYPSSAVTYWLGVAGLLLNSRGSPTFWDVTPGNFTPPPPAPALSVAAGGTLAAYTAYARATFVTALGESLPSAEAALSVPANNLLSIASPGGAIPTGVTAWNAYVGTAPGAETLQNKAPTLIGAAWTEPTTGLVAGGAPPAVGTAGPRTLLDVGTELFAAHNLALEAQAGDAAAVSAVPGTVAGPIASRSVNGVSVSYDASSGIEIGDGHWNLTIYGRRLIRLARLVGAVPLQIGIGADPTGGMNGPGWAGPPPWIVGSPGSGIY